MATARDYFEYLSNNIDIAPANSQEELVASGLISNLMDQHGLAPQVQEFEAASIGGLMHYILLILMFVGSILVGVGGPGVYLLGLVLVAVPAIVLALEDMGQPLVGDLALGPKAKSQNVIGFHEGVIPPDDENGRRRPIVIMAHYDTARANVLRTAQTARYGVMIRKGARYCVIAVVACALLRLLVFLPNALRVLIWLVGIVAALPLVAIAVTSIMECFADCTDGANDNKSGVAAMLGLMGRLFPEADAADGAAAGVVRRPPIRLLAGQAEAPVADSTDDAAAVEPVAEAPYAAEGPLGVRHGKDVIQKLGILPSSCEIEYSVADFHVEPEPEVIEEPEVEEAADEREAAAEPEAEAADEELADETTDIAAEDDVDEGATSELEPLAVADEEPTATMSLVFEDEPPADDSIPRDVSGLDTISDEIHMDDEAPKKVKRPRPPAVEDPDWGKSTFRPTVSNVARRAALFDLPDPSQTGSADPLGPSSDAQKTMVASRSSMAERLAHASASMPNSSARTLSAVPQVDDAADTALETITPEVAPEPEAEAEAPKEKAKRSFWPFGRKKREEESMSEWLGVDDDYDAKTAGRKIGSWDNFDDEEDDSSSWKGGAAKRADLRVVEGDGDEAENDLLDDIVEEAEESEQLSFDDVMGDELPEEAADEPIEDEADDEAAEEAAEDDVATEPEPDPELSLVEDDVDDEAAYADNADEDEGEDSPTEEEMRAAVLAMDDDEILAHDIWFVAVGGSGLGHAGTKAFLEKYRSKIRGGFLINLDCVGAGSLGLVGNEGLINSRRADRRITRIMNSTAADLGIAFGKRVDALQDTDATPAMRSSVRAVTLSGIGEDGIPVPAHSLEDTHDAVDLDQIQSVVELIAESIRRS